MKDLVNYRFLEPLDDDTWKYFKYTFKEYWQSSDGAPDLHIVEGLLIEKDKVKDLPSNLSFNTYEISDRFTDKDDFITTFWDGDVDDGDFIYEEI